MYCPQVFMSSMYTPALVTRLHLTATAAEAAMIVALPLAAITGATSTLVLYARAALAAILETPERVTKAQDSIDGTAAHCAEFVIPVEPCWRLRFARGPLLSSVSSTHRTHPRAQTC